MPRDDSGLRVFAVGGPSEGCCDGTGQARVKAGSEVEYGSFPSRFGCDWTALYRIWVRAKSRFKVLTPLDPRVSPIPPALAQLDLSFGRAGWREAATVIEGVYNGLRQQTDGEGRAGSSRVG